MTREDTQSQSTVIFTNSESVKNSFQNRTTDHPLIRKILSYLLEMYTEGRSLTICWVPAHIGIAQNDEVADGAREAARGDAPVTNQRVHYRDYYPLIREVTMRQWKRNWQNTQDNKLRLIKGTV